MYVIDSMAATTLDFRLTPGTVTWRDWEKSYSPAFVQHRVCVPLLFFRYPHYLLGAD